MKPLKHGFLIAIEGIDGSGKSTLARNLYNNLIKQKIPVVLTKEPGATPLGAQLRTLLHKKPWPICPKSEYLLFATDRAQHMVDIIKPALEKNAVVISDRMGDSSVVYQGYARGLDIEMIKQINRWAMNNIGPNLVFYVKLSAQQAVDRIKQRNEALTSFEKESEAFIQALVDGFDRLFNNQPHIVHLDGTKTPTALLEQALDSISSILSKKL